MVILSSKPLESLLQVEAMLDKTISALSNVFIGSSGSTFTEDIFRLRRGWGSMSYCDEYLCQGELPNYIAEQD
jgi:peptide-O-fucosyltransferase